MSKKKALELGIDVLQPENLKDAEFIEKLKTYNPDIIAVVAFRILPKEVYTLPKLGCFNIHASLLPKYRGAAPINWAIINGEKITGLTSFLIQEKSRYRQHSAAKNYPDTRWCNCGRSSRYYGSTSSRSRLRYLRASIER